MISKRSIIIGVLFCLPVLVYVGFGAYALWKTGLFLWTWWIIPGCWFLTYGVAEVWKPKRFDPDSERLPTHWTPFDEAATKIVTQYQQEVDTLSPEELTDMEFYFQKSQDLAQSLAEHYHPKAKDVYSSLTVLEVLAATRLAVEDLEVWFHDSVPGSHLVTIEQWKMLGKAPKWVKRVSDAGWVASVLVNPLNVAKYFSSKLTLDPITEQLRTEFLAAAYLRFVRLVGFYLIEMNSGRLRRGADRYRAAFGPGPELKEKQPPENPNPLKPESVVVAVVGQVKAGKSSVVNAFIGKTEAVTDVLPSTKLVTRHQLDIPDSQVKVTLLDTPGYADAGATKAALRETQTAVREADIIVLVTAANSPGKAADIELLREVEKDFAKHPELKPSPIIVCMTHIDLLSPVMEWEPPYDFENPTRSKEESIVGALKNLQQLFADLKIPPVEYIPVCSDADRDRLYNIPEGLIPALATHLQAGKTVALVKAYEKDLDQGSVSSLLHQLKATGKNLLNLWVQERLNETKN